MSRFEIELSAGPSHPWILTERVESDRLVPVLGKARDWLRLLGGTLWTARVVRDGNVSEATWVWPEGAVVRSPWPDHESTPSP